MRRREDNLSSIEGRKILKEYSRYRILQHDSFFFIFVCVKIVSVSNHWLFEG